MDVMKKLISMCCQVKNNSRRSPYCLHDLFRSSLDSHKIPLMFVLFEKRAF